MHKLCDLRSYRQILMILKVSVLAMPGTNSYHRHTAEEHREVVVQLHQKYYEMLPSFHCGILVRKVRYPTLTFALTSISWEAEA